MSVVLDTNVLVAAFLTNGTSREVLRTVSRHDRWLVTAYILEELERILAKKIGASRGDRRRAMALIRRMATVISWMPITDPVPGVEDAKDWPILWFCHHHRADLLVTGDQELIVLERFRQTDIVMPRTYLQRMHGHG